MTTTDVFVNPVGEALGYDWTKDAAARGTAALAEALAPKQDAAVVQAPTVGA